jgi:2-oxo-4-hydroxy-4-carboxy-5-ureidoimidazoline decarboxylase
MTFSVRDLDSLPLGRATELLAACCGASRWVSSMAARRPFHSLDALLAAADDVWWSLDPTDWREAFSHHPRIGESVSAVAQDERARDWASTEQAGVATARDTVRIALAAANREYERKFGYIYIVCASGKSAEEMLSLARERLANAPDAELRVAAEEQRKITRLRLEKLLAAEQTT